MRTEISDKYLNFCCIDFESKIHFDAVLGAHYLEDAEEIVKHSCLETIHS